MLICMGLFVVSSALMEKDVEHWVLTVFAVLILAVYASPILLAGEWIDNFFGGRAGGLQVRGSVV